MINEKILSKKIVGDEQLDRVNGGVVYLVPVVKGTIKAVTILVPVVKYIIKKKNEGTTNDTEKTSMLKPTGIAVPNRDLSAY
jgi:hypothetical protein